MSNRYFEALDSLKLNYLHNQTVLIAGSTGMIGSCLVDAIMHANLHANLNCRVFAFGRREQAARRRFYGWYDHPLFQFCAQDVNEPIEHFTENIDFLIHAASNADPVRFATAPVETLLANVLGTKHLLELGRTHNMARFLFVSSGEMYGQPDGNPDGFVETYCGQIDHASPRSCYPAGKRAAEVLCQSYIAEYGVDAVIVRPCHIFGPTMTEHDSRALSQFFRNAVKGENITLKSPGLVERSHCHVADAASAVFYVLEHGLCGEAYNIANRVYQMTIRAFAQKVAEVSGVKLTFENPSDIEAKGYSSISRSVLSDSKLLKLGWTPFYQDDSAIKDTFLVLSQIQNHGGWVLVDNCTESER